MIEKNKPKVKKKLPKNVRERNGSFTYRYSIPNPLTGKRKQKETIAYVTPAEAAEAGVLIEAELIKGTFIEGAEILFADWCDRWIEMYTASGRVKERTVEIRKSSLNHAKKEFIGKKLKEIEPIDIQRLFNKMKLQNKSKATINLAYIACKMLFEKAMQLKLIKFNPMDGVELPAFQVTVEQLESAEELPLYLEKEELALLLKTAKTPETLQSYHGLFILAYTGLRIGEMLALKLTDFDEVNKQLSITKTLDMSGKITLFKLSTPKTTSSIRKVDLGEAVIKIIKNQIQWRNEFKMSTNKNFYKKADFLFVNQEKFPGYPLSLRRLEEFMDETLELAKLSTIPTPHHLRHTYCSLMAEAGADLETIQGQLGHKNDEVTRLVYTHVTKARKKRDVAKLDALMDGLL